MFVSVQLLMSKHLSTTIKTASPVALLGDASSSTDGSRKVMEEGRASGLMVECGKEKKNVLGVYIFCRGLPLLVTKFLLYCTIRILCKHNYFFNTMREHT